MLVWKTWTKSKRDRAGVVWGVKKYKILLLFGFIPLFIWING